MQRKKIMNRAAKILFSVVAFMASMTWSAVAQSNATTAFSPYSMYGVGEINTQGALPMRSMGGMGVAWRSTSMASLLNPAGYSATLRKSFIFNFGAEGMYAVNSQNRYDASTGAATGSVKSAKTTANFHDIALQMPLGKGVGLGFSITPYSSVGYNMTAIEQDENAWAEVGQVKYNYQGDGDITEVKLGVGWEIFNGFSLGVAGMYYWGDINRQYTTKIASNIVGDGTSHSALGSENFSVSNVKFQAGVQYSVINNDKRSLTIGATYDIGGSLRPKLSETFYVNNIAQTPVFDRHKRDEIRLPMQVACGIFYQDVNWSAGVDYVYQNWKGENAKIADIIEQGVEVAYANTSTIKAGIEYTPNRFDVRRYYNRMSYRAGFRYGGYYQTFGGEQLNQYAVTVGIGFPLRFLGASSVDVGFEYGNRGSNKRIAGGAIGLVQQQYFKFAIGLSMFGEDYWFVRPKYD
jgi:hypothetical protein